MAGEMAGDRLKADRRLKLEGSGLVAYLEWAALSEPTAFLSLLAKILPYQIHARSEQFKREVYMTLEEARARLKERGIPIEDVYTLVTPRLLEPPKDGETEH